MSVELDSKPNCNALHPEGCIRHEGFCIDSKGPPCTNGLWDKRLPAAPHIIMICPCEARGTIPQEEDMET